MAIHHGGQLDYAWSNFLNEKSELKNVMMGLIKNLKPMCNIQVQHLWCDHSRENFGFERACKQEWMRMGMEFEYIASGTPQQNDHVEQKSATLFNRVHAILKHGNFSPF